MSEEDIQFQIYVKAKNSKDALHKAQLWEYQNIKKSDRNKIGISHCIKIKRNKFKCYGYHKSSYKDFEI